MTDTDVDPSDLAHGGMVPHDEMVAMARSVHGRPARPGSP
jgi:hypothetical protein